MTELNWALARKKGTLIRRAEMLQDRLNFEDRMCPVCRPGRGRT